MADVWLLLGMGADVAFKMFGPFEASPAMWAQALLNVGGRSVPSTAACL